jgi:hypothetical protein
MRATNCLGGSVQFLFVAASDRDLPTSGGQRARGREADSASPACD